MNIIGPAPVPIPSNSKTAIDTFVLFIPLITAVLTAITTFLTVLIKEKLFQNTKDKNSFIGQRLQNCYTILHLKLQTKKNFSVGFLKGEVNDIIVKYGYLLDVPLLKEYIVVYDLEIKALQILDLNKELMSKIDDIKSKIDSLDKSNSMYDKYFELYTANWNEYINQSQQVIELYGKAEEKYIEGVKNFRNNLEMSYKSLIKQYFGYFNTDTTIEDVELDNGQES
jgi:hypothetical protein